MIEQVKVTRETESNYWVLRRGGPIGDQKEYEERRFKRHYHMFETFQQAKEHVVRLWETKVKQRTEQLALAQRYLESFRNLKEDGAR